MKAWYCTYRKKGNTNFTNFRN